MKRKLEEQIKESDKMCIRDRSEFLSDAEVEELRNDKEFMEQAIHFYQKADIGVDQAIKDGVKELYEDYKEVTVVEFDEDLDEIEME